MPAGQRQLASGTTRSDLVRFVNARVIPRPLRVVGHSMGGLLAQLVAARTRHSGLVAACPGSAAGIFGTTTHEHPHGNAFLTKSASVGQARVSANAGAIQSVDLQ